MGCTPIKSGTLAKGTVVADRTSAGYRTSSDVIDRSPGENKEEKVT
jgi:hypothetical protein